MKLSRFFKRNCAQVSPQPEELLNTFAIKLYRLLYAEYISVLAPGEAYEETTNHTNKLYKVLTDTGILFTKNQIGDNIVESFTPASIEEISGHYRTLANRALNSKVANNEALAATAFLLGKQLKEEHPEYQDIEVDICELSNWEHAFIKIKLSDLSEYVYFDPYSLFLCNFPSNSIIGAHQYAYIMQKNHERLYKDDNISIYFRRNIFCFPKDAGTNQLVKMINGCDDFAYSTTCSTAQFTNPSELPIEASSIVVEDSSSCIPCF